MIDSAVQKNLLLWDKVFQSMKSASLGALNRGQNFLPIHYTLRHSAPYIDNMAVFCNEYLGAQIEIPETENLELFALAELYRQKIDDIHQVIQSQNFKQEVMTDFYNNDTMEELGNLLYEINRVTPSQQGYIQRYFMQGVLLCAIAVESYRRLEAEAGLARSINRSELSENLLEILSRQGIEMNEDNESSIYELLCQTCGDVLSSRKPAIPSELNRKLSHAFQDAFQIDCSVFNTAFEDQSKILCNFIKTARENMNQPQASIRNLMLFAQNLEPIPHNDAEKIIYISKVNEHVYISDDKLSLNKPLPKYVLPFSETKEFKAVQSQMTYWNAYEQNADNFDKRIVNVYGGMMSLAWLNHLYQDLSYYEELLDNVSEQKDDDDDNVKFHAADSRSSELELLEYARNLIVASRYSEKYIDFDINKTGVEETTIDIMDKKDTLNEQDLNVLRELFYYIGHNLNDGLQVLQSIDVPDYASAIQVVVSMPHGSERKEALTCADGALSAVFEDMYEAMESSLFDIDCIIGQSKPEADEMLKDFIANTINKYPDLNNETVESLAQKIHTGVEAAYLIPLYQNTKTNEKRKNASVAFIDNYDEMQPETQKFLLGLTQYYAQQVSSIHPMWKKKDYSPEFKEALEEYQDIQVSLQYITDLQDEVTQALTEEKILSARYHKYQKQKAMFELPKNFDLKLAAQFLDAKKQR